MSKHSARLPSIKIDRTKAMKGIMAALAGMLVVACSGCGGGGGGTASAPESIKTPVNSVLIEAYGDSTIVGCTYTAGSNGQGECPANYSIAYYNQPATLQSILQSQFGSSVTVTNRGHIGTTLANLLNGTNGFTMTWAAQMAASKASIVLLSFGINDAYLGSTTPDQFVAEIDAAVSVAKSAGKVVVLQTSNPVTAAPSNPYLAALVAAEMAEAQRLNVPVVDQNSFILTQPNWQSLLSDGIHPTNTGYELMAHNEAPVLATLVQAAMQ